MLDVFSRPPEREDVCGSWIIEIIDGILPALGPDDDTEDMLDDMLEEMLADMLEEMLAEDVFAGDKASDEL